MSVDYKLIGCRIKEARKAKALTQERLAESISVSIGYVSQLERGVTKISLDTLSEIAYVLDKDVSYFLSCVAVEQRSYLRDEFYQKCMGMDKAQKNLLMEIADSLIEYGKSICK